MKVKCYNSGKFQKTTTYEVVKITAMPEPEEITEEDIENCDGIMLGLWLTNGDNLFIPHEFLIEIIP